MTQHRTPVCEMRSAFPHGCHPCLAGGLVHVLKVLLPVTAHGEGSRDDVEVDHYVTRLRVLPHIGALAAAWLTRDDR